MYAVGKIAMWSPMIGNVNVYNVLAACAAGYARDCSAEAIAKGIFDLTSVPGRFERVDCGQPFTVVVDYAHTDDALRNLTALARDFVTRAGLKARSSRFSVWWRSRSRQASADGEARAREATLSCSPPTIPRSEDPLAIMTMQSLDCANVRRQIFHGARPPQGHRFALALATPGDIVLLAGKGHERCRSQRTEPFRSMMWMWAREADGLGYDCQNRRESGHRREDRMKLLLSRIAESFPRQARLQRANTTVMRRLRISMTPARCNPANFFLL